MKTNYTLFSGLAVVICLLAGSCKKFIKEELVTTLTQEYYKTDNGLEDLVKSAYVPLKWKFEGEQSYALWNFGVDEFRLGDQFNSWHFNTYNSDLNANGNDGFLNGLWINYYAGINRCNLGIEYINAFNDPNSSKLGTAAQKNLRIGELQFLRGFYYFTLVQQFGGVPLVINSPKELKSEFPRASVAEVYNQVMADFRTAGPALPWSVGEKGRATRQRLIISWQRHILPGAALLRIPGGKKQPIWTVPLYLLIRLSSLARMYWNLILAIYLMRHMHLPFPKGGHRRSGTGWG